MKQAITSLTVLAIAITPNLANANQTQQKINIVKSVYNEAKRTDDSMAAIMRHATPGLRNHYNRTTICDNDPLWGNQDPQTNAAVKVSNASNGRVKATFKQYGQTATNYFKFKCTGNTCKISDISFYSCE